MYYILGCNYSLPKQLIIKLNKLYFIAIEHYKYMYWIVLKYIVNINIQILAVPKPC